MTYMYRRVPLTPPHQQRPQKNSGIPAPSAGLEDVFLAPRAGPQNACSPCSDTDGVQFYGTSVQVHEGINRHL